MIKEVVKRIKNVLKEHEVKYPVILESFGILESTNPTTDKAYGTITYIYEDGTTNVIQKYNKDSWKLNVTRVPGPIIRCIG